MSGLGQEFLENVIIQYKECIKDGCNGQVS